MSSTTAHAIDACYGRPESPEVIQQWVNQFDRDGFLFLPGFLPGEVVEQLKADLDAALIDPGPDYDQKELIAKIMMFERSQTNIALFDLEPMVTFAETVLGDSCTVFHNNSFKTPPGHGISQWHQDDAAHYEVTEGEPPTNVRLPCLFFTCNYYLTDVLAVEDGPTTCVRGSHLIGKPVPEDVLASDYADRVVDCLGPAGSVCIFNNQVWHRGSPNTGSHTRYMTQVSYGRRMIGNLYPPYMNYTMPEHVHADANPRLKRLLGFKTPGAYA